MKIVFSGMLAGVPGQGGATWAVLQYLLGFSALGHDVLLVEPVEELRPDAIAYFDDVAMDFDVEGAMLVAGTQQMHGASYLDVEDFVAGADVLFNVAGILQEPNLVADIPVRVYLDLDPAFTQLWHAVDGIDMRFGGHNRFVTVGTRIGAADCRVPTCDLDWIPTLPPVVLDHWPVAGETTIDAFTTVANWRGYGSVWVGDELFGQKVHSLRRFMALPTKVPVDFVLALGIHPDETPDVNALSANGWTVLDPVDCAGTPPRYARFVQGSKAELGIAKDGYVRSRSGWFSDRSACYLASGRPVVAQDTGFSAVLPTGDGLLAFADEEGAVAAIEAVERNYDAHRRAARAIAEEHLDARRVLGRLLERVAG